MRSKVLIMLWIGGVLVGVAVASLGVIGFSSIAALGFGSGGVVLSGLALRAITEQK
jgi:hypothetical protein